MCACLLPWGKAMPRLGEMPVGQPCPTVIVAPPPPVSVRLSLVWIESILSCSFSLLWLQNVEMMLILLQLK